MPKKKKREVNAKFKVVLNGFKRQIDVAKIFTSSIFHLFLLGNVSSIIHPTKQKSRKKILIFF